jgi:hypothetical protein
MPYEMLSHTEVSLISLFLRTKHNNLSHNRQKITEIRRTMQSAKNVPTIKAYYIGDGTLLRFGRSLNLKTTVFQNTEKHTHIVQATELKKQITGSSFKLFDIRTTPVSTQDRLKPLPNTKQLLQTSPPQPKTSMAVNQQLYTEVPEDKALNLITILENDPKNSNPQVNRSVANIRHEQSIGNIEPTVFEEKNYINVRHVQEFINEYPPAEPAFKQVISTRFVKSTCIVLEGQCNHLIAQREDPKAVKEVVNDIADTLSREKTNISPYSPYEQQEIEKAHYYMDILKKYLK